LCIASWELTPSSSSQWIADACLDCSYCRQGDSPRDTLPRGVNQRMLTSSPFRIRAAVLFRTTEALRIHRRWIVPAVRSVVHQDAHKDPRWNLIGGE
jgi:hypothetical protein